MSLAAKWLEFVQKLNSRGLPLPVVRDPKSGNGSVTVTLVILSSGLCAITILIMLGTCLARLSSNFVLNSETSAEIHEAFVSSLQFLIASLGAYLGRKFQGDSKQVTLDSGDPK